jgi:hypothetical protein
MLLILLRRLPVLPYVHDVYVHDGVMLSSRFA